MATNYNTKNTDGLKIINNWEELYKVVKNMEKKKIILDTDMYNEVDDQFALVYLMKSLDVFELEAITIAPFLHSHYSLTGIKTVAEGIEKSYETTLKLLDMLDKTEYKSMVYKGATNLTKDNSEFNFRQDIKAVQTVFN